MDLTGNSASSAIDCLPREIIEYILKWLTPQSIKRFGQTCKAFNKIASDYQTSREYAHLLGLSAVKFLPHFITGVEKATEKGHIIRTEIISLIGLAVVRCPKKPVSRWSTNELVKFLYPLSINLLIWPEAVYAFEWCANCSDEQFQPELKALLLPDAFDQLTAIDQQSHSKRTIDAKQFQKFGIKHRWYGNARESIRSYISSMECNGNGVLMIAALAASDAYDSSFESINAYKSIVENTKVPLAGPSPIRNKLKRFFNFANLMFSTKEFTLSKRELDWFQQIGITNQYRGHVLPLPVS